MARPSINDIEAQLSANRRYWAGWSDSDPDADLPIYRTDIPHPHLNGVLRVRNLAMDEAIAEARSKLRGTSFYWWVGDDSDPGTADKLMTSGATKEFSTPIMAARTADFPAFSKQLPWLTVQRVTDKAAMREFVRTYSEPFGFPTDAEAFVTERELDYATRSDNVIRLAGQLNGRIVATAQVSLGEVAGLYCICTDRDYRRLGIATALTAASIRIARENGARIATLQASAAGAIVYRAMGFQDVGHYDVYRF